LDSLWGLHVLARIPLAATGDVGRLSRSQHGFVHEGHPDRLDVKAGKTQVGREAGHADVRKPVVAGPGLRRTNKLWLGTPRNPATGVLMCSANPTGGSLAARDEKLDSKIDCPRPVCSSPLVEGERLYYVSNPAS